MHRRWSGSLVFRNASQRLRAVVLRLQQNRSRGLRPQSRPLYPFACYSRLPLCSICPTLNVRVAEMTRLPGLLLATTRNAMTPPYSRMIHVFFFFFLLTLFLFFFFSFLERTSKFHRLLFILLTSYDQTSIFLITYDPATIIENAAGR